MNTTPENQPPSDDGLDWLRDIRRQIYAECGSDPDTYIERLRALEKLPQYARRMVRVRKILEPVHPE